VSVKQTYTPDSGFNTLILRLPVVGRVTLHRPSFILIKL